MTQNYQLTWTIFADAIKNQIHQKNSTQKYRMDTAVHKWAGQFRPYKQFLPLLTPYFKLFYDTICLNDFHPWPPYFKHLSLLPNILAPMKIVIIHLPPSNPKVTFFWTPNPLLDIFFSAYP